MREEDEIWALAQAARRSGFTPHAKSTADFLIELEHDGLLHRVGMTWYITEQGRERLQRLERDR